MEKNRWTDWFADFFERRAKLADIDPDTAEYQTVLTGLADEQAVLAPLYKKQKGKALSDEVNHGSVQRWQALIRGNQRTYDEWFESFAKRRLKLEKMKPESLEYDIVMDDWTTEHPVLKDAYIAMNIGLDGQVNEWVANKKKADEEALSDGEKLDHRINSLREQTASKWAEWRSLEKRRLDLENVLKAPDKPWSNKDDENWEKLMADAQDMRIRREENDWGTEGKASIEKKANELQKELRDEARQPPSRAAKNAGDRSRSCNKPVTAGL